MPLGQISGTDERREAEIQARAERSNRWNKYEMPRPRMGQYVAYHDKGLESDDPELAVVLEVKQRTVRLRTQISQRSPICPCLHDPRVREGGADHRAMGAWDFLPSDKHSQDVVSRVDAVERRVSEALQEFAQLVRTLETKSETAVENITDLFGKVQGVHLKMGRLAKKVEKVAAVLPPEPDDEQEEADPTDAD